MKPRINLLVKKSRAREGLDAASKLFSVSILFFFMLAASVMSAYGYWYYLNRQHEELDKHIASAKNSIQSYEDVEQLKGIIILKLTEADGLVSRRFDFVKAIEDVNTVLGFSITIEEMKLFNTGVVSLTARKSSQPRFAGNPPASVAVHQIQLKIIVPSSSDIDEIIQHLTNYHGKTLVSANVVRTTLNTDGEYEIELELNLAKNS
ncbi:MAG TPA: hypothetical protein VJL83_00295 [Patescibacteria group bacterium]|nr:hypothetical protein [Patescibacteria group bacterium]